MASWLATGFDIPACLTYCWIASTHIAEARGGSDGTDESAVALEDLTCLEDEPKRPPTDLKDPENTASKAKTGQLE